MSSYPNIILVHGAFADGSSWSKVIPLLPEKGYNVTSVQIPLTSLADAEGFLWIDPEAFPESFAQGVDPLKPGSCPQCKNHFQQVFSVRKSTRLPGSPSLPGIWYQRTTECGTKRARKQFFSFFHFSRSFKE